MAEHIGQPGNLPGEVPLRVAHGRLVDSLIWTIALNERGNLARFGNQETVHAVKSMLRERPEYPRTATDDALMTINGVVLVYKWRQGRLELPVVGHMFKEAGVSEETITKPLVEAAGIQMHNWAGSMNLRMAHSTVAAVKTLGGMDEFPEPWTTELFDSVAYDKAQVLGVNLILNGHQINDGDYLKWVTDNPEKATMRNT